MKNWLYFPIFIRKLRQMGLSLQFDQKNSLNLFNFGLGNFSILHFEKNIFGSSNASAKNGNFLNKITGGDFINSSKRSVEKNPFTVAYGGKSVLPNQKGLSSTSVASSLTNTVSVGSQIFKVYYKYFFLLFIILFIYFLYNYTSYFTSNVLVKEPVYLKQGSKQIKIDTGSLKNYISSSYNIWVYLNKKIDSGKKGTIFQLNNSLVFEAYNGYLANGVVALYIDGSNNLIFTDSQNKFTVMTNFPNNKWTNVAINIHQMLYYECYINGKLVNTFKTSGDTNKPNTDFTIFFGGDTPLPDIVINNFTIQPYTQDSETIWNNFVKGSQVNTSYETIIPIGSNNIANKAMNLIDINYFKGFSL